MARQIKELAMKTMEFQFECGRHKGVVKASSIGAAWRKLTKGQKDGFAPLARFVIGRPGEVWKYITPAALDRMP